MGHASRRATSAALSKLAGALLDEGWGDESIALVRAAAEDIVAATKSTAAMSELLREWLETPYFETQKEFDAWARSFRPRVEKVLKGLNTEASLTDEPEAA